MSKEQTAMKKLIKMLFETPKDFNCLGLIIQRANELLELEKQQIINSYNNGKINRADAEKYFNNKFNNEKL